MLRCKYKKLLGARAIYNVAPAIFLRRGCINAPALGISVILSFLLYVDELTAIYELEGIEHTVGVDFSSPVLRLDNLQLTSVHAQVESRSLF